MKTVFLAPMVIFTSHFYASDLHTIQGTSFGSERAELLEVVLTLPFEDLIINTDGISINYEGTILTVHTLEKQGEEWVVRARRNCQNGHPIACYRCHGCAASGC